MTTIGDRNMAIEPGSSDWNTIEEMVRRLGANSVLDAVEAMDDSDEEDGDGGDDSDLAGVSDDDDHDYGDPDE